MSVVGSTLYLEDMLQNTKMFSLLIFHSASCSLHAGVRLLQAGLPALRIIKIVEKPGHESEHDEMILLRFNGRIFENSTKRRVFARNPAMALSI